MHWNNVKDKLPPLYHEVLVYIKRDAPAAFWMDEANMYVGHVYQDAQKNKLWNTIHKVLFWSELPKGPEENK